MGEIKFALTKDFESIISGTLKDNSHLELTKFSNDEYILLEHKGDLVEEIYTFTKEELKALWMMLTIK